jgi:dTDP-4-amino-4,6-dideoxygalactose transaminase
MLDFIPFAIPAIDDDEINEVVTTLKSGWLTTGPQTRRFETDFSTYLDREHAIAVNSATAGLHLALEAVGVTDGDVVITTVYTFTATAEVIRYLNGTPVFVDINPRTKNIDLNQLKKALDLYRGRVKAIIPVHFAGLACEMDEIFKYAKDCGAVVIEDAAHALPTTYKGKLVGSFGDITVFSFYATKTLATGEGGMVVTDNAIWAERIKSMRLHGINRDVFDRYSSSKPSWYYEVVAPGYKYNLTDVASAIGIHQLRKLEGMRQRRKNIADMYLSSFAGLPLELPYYDVNDVHAWHLFTIELITEKLTINRETFINKMADAGVGTSVHFIPLHRHPYWRDTYSLDDSDFPVATDKYLRTLSLPIYPRMSDKEVQRVITAVQSICKNHTK